jgi:quercetin dioxygenase-like cupin family protein
MGHAKSKNINVILRNKLPKTIAMQEKNNQEKIKKLAAQAQRLIDLIDYQEGSVVSRTIMDKKAGTVTLFAFDENEGLSEHTAPFDALVYILKGEAKVTISGKPFKLKEGELIIMPANEPHSLSAVTKFKMLLIMIRK